MKKNLKWLLCLLSTMAILFAGCATDGGDSTSSPEVTPGTVGTGDPALLAASKASAADTSSDAILYYYRPDGNYSPWGLWLWKAGGDGQPGYDATSGKVQTVTVDGKKIAYWNLTQLVGSDATLGNLMSTGDKMGLIIRDASWAKDPGVDQEMDFSIGKRFFVLSGDSTVYDVSAEIKPTITAAVSVSRNTIKANLSVTYGLETVASDNGFVLKTDDGEVITIEDVVNFDAPNNRYKNNAKSVLIKLATDIDAAKTYLLSKEGFDPADGVEVSVQGAVKDSATYDGNDLGLTLEGNKATFKVWAPVASDVKLLVYATSADVGTFNAASNTAKAVGSTTDKELYGTPAVDTIQMVKDSTNNVWSATIDDVSGYKYYKYQIVNNGTTYYVCDTYAKATSADSIAAQIVDINSAAEAIPSSTTDTAFGTTEGYYNPFKKDYSDAVIYEMHITDWSAAESGEYKNTAAGNVGKYLTVANSEKIINHLKDIGITHVQILPVFEFAETNANEKYNWGYNPYHYNVPEGRYVTVGYEDGTQAVLEFRTLVAKLHEAGISVIMDVVYNHTNGTQGGSLYDSQVPYYFYRFDASGGYSNGSGCGNEVDTEAPMMKKYIIESLKNWMLDYHINGFRFDLMGCIAKETMADIYDALYEIDPSVLVYGEPWTGGTAAVENGAVSAGTASSGLGYGAFDDDLRDAIKGAEFGGFKHGQVQGTINDSAINALILGKVGINKRNSTGKLGLALHYVECHDNYTLFDKLAISYWRIKNNKTGEEVKTGNLFSAIGEDGIATVKAWDKLSAAYVFLSQGTAFLNGGQEFLRTKRGNHNSYNTSNTNSYSTNGIDLTFKETYSDVYNVYKGLIALRKANPEAFGANEAAKTETYNKVSGVTKYTTGDFLVYFNATEEAVNIDTAGYSKVVDVTSGTPTESATLPTTVPASGFVILKK